MPFPVSKTAILLTKSLSETHSVSKMVDLLTNSVVSTVRPLQERIIGSSSVSAQKTGPKSAALIFLSLWLLRERLVLEYILSLKEITFRDLSATPRKRPRGLRGTGRRAGARLVWPVRFPSKVGDGRGGQKILDQVGYDTWCGKGMRVGQRGRVRGQENFYWQVGKYWLNLRVVTAETKRRKQRGKL